MSAPMCTTRTEEVRCKTFLNRVTLEPSHAAANELREWWQALEPSHAAANELREWCR